MGERLLESHALRVTWKRSGDLAGVGLKKPSYPEKVPSLSLVSLSFKWA